MAARHPRQRSRGKGTSCPAPAPKLTHDRGTINGSDLTAAISTKPSICLQRPLRLHSSDSLVIQTPQQGIRKDRTILGWQSHHLVFKNCVVHDRQNMPQHHHDKATFNPSPKRTTR